MSKFFLIIFLLSVEFSYSQHKSDSLIVKKSFLQESYDYTINEDSILTIYADSLSQVNGEISIPTFLFDACFEKRLPIVRDFHSSKDLRWEIIKRVKTKKAIAVILNSKDKCLMKLCCDQPSHSTSPFVKSSIYDLLKLRYGMLE